MLTQVLTLQEVPLYLDQLTTPLDLGKEILILRDNQPLAKLVAPTLAASGNLPVEASSPDLGKISNRPE